MKNKFEYEKVIILHGCPPTEEMVTPQSNRWMNWLVGKLREKGIDAIAPDMPMPWNPKYTEWKKTFAQNAINQNTVLIGHSCGAAFLVRWLIETKNKAKKLILVAPAKIPENNLDTRKDLYDFYLPEDASYIADEIIIFTSNDFPHHLKSLRLYISSLNPRVITLKNKFHFLYFQMKTNEFPELLQEVIHG